MDFLTGLNPQQREAVCHGEGPLLILAGAGSGKTRVITHRIAHLIHATGVAGNAILAVTFTNKAAGEMRDRVAALLEGVHGGFAKPVVSTFHSFCVRMLRRDGHSLASLRPGFTPQFLIYDDDEQLSTVKAIYRNLGLDEKFMQPRAAQSRISHAKNHKRTPQHFYQNAGDPKSERLAVVYEQYEERLRQANALDFDDLLLEAVRLLRHDELVRDTYNSRFRHLLIDEYQDTNRSQYELMRLLTQKHSNVCVVGDEDQSIYGWRGADIRNILDFERDYPGAATIRLEQNYRSTKTIIEAASAVVANNKERKGKWLWTDAGKGDKIGLYQAPDAEQEALFIADSTEQILRQHQDRRVAILYRTNAQSRQIEEALRRYGRQYIVVGGLSFYQRAEIKDVLGYLKLLANPNDSVSFHRVVNKPARGIGKTTVEQIDAHALAQGCSPWEALLSLLEQKLLSTRANAALKGFQKLMESWMEAAEEESVAYLLRSIISDSGYRDMLKSGGTQDSETRLENLDELVNAAEEAAIRGEGIIEFLDHAALVSEADRLDESIKVSLLTMHNAKGLEWPVVFIAGMEEGLFPHARSLESESLMEEERRLCYVAMTRAEKRLLMTFSRARRKFGGGPLESRTMSRFLFEVPQKFAERIDDPRGPAGAIPEVDLFAEQDHVRETVRRNTYTGKTYNSVENIAQFFQERGTKPAPATKPAQPSAPRPPAGAPPAARQSAQKTRPKERLRAGVTVEHARYGRGMVLRKEGNGEDAKLTVSFPGHGLKKLVAKYAGLRVTK
jgi:DNA helicase-2/ATP-dependent DNA helicase PcrA